MSRKILIFLSLVLSLTMLFCLASCGETPDNDKPGEGGDLEGGEETKPGDGENSDDGGTKPGDGEQKPDDGTHKPDEGGDNPDGNKPDDGTHKPDEGGDNPDGNKPDEGGDKPDHGGSKPDDGETKPDDGQQKPDDGTSKPGDRAEFLGAGPNGESLSNTITASLTSPTETAFAFSGEVEIISVSNSWGSEALLFYTNEKAWIDYDGSYRIPVTVNPIGTDGTTDISISLIIVYRCGEEERVAKAEIQAFPDTSFDPQIEVEYLGFYTELYDSSYRFDPSKQLGQNHTALDIDEYSIVFVFSGLVNYEYATVEGRRWAINGIDTETDPTKTAVFFAHDFEEAGLYTVTFVYEYFSYEENVLKTSSVEIEISIVDPNSGANPDDGNSGTTPNPDDGTKPEENFGDGTYMGVRISGEQLTGSASISLSTEGSFERDFIFNREVKFVSATSSLKSEDLLDVVYEKAFTDSDGYYNIPVFINLYRVNVEPNTDITIYFTYEADGAEHTVNVVVHVLP